jgi:hypothetical protein
MAATRPPAIRENGEVDAKLEGLTTPTSPKVRFLNSLAATGAAKAEVGIVT